MKVFILFYLGKGIVDAITTSVLRDVDTRKIFPLLSEHMFDTPVNENHVIVLTKLVCKNFSKIRMYHLGKEQNQKLAGENIRKQYNKLVLFKYQ